MHRPARDARWRRGDRAQMRQAPAARVSSASSRASSSRSWRRSTIRSSAPFSSRNSARWKPSGSFSRTVCSITRGPAKPISAPGSAMTRSATNANDRRHAAHRRVGEDRHERQPRLGQLLQHRRGLRHLEQRVDAFLHARAAGGRDAHERHAVLVRDAHAAHEALADDRAHRAAHELELERGEHERHALDAALHHDQRIGLAGLLERRGEALRILLLVLELEAVDRHDLGADLEAAFRIEQLLDALARVDARVVAALRADVEVLLEVGAIEHRFARRALDPQALRAPACFALARRALDARRQQLLQPAHRSTPVDGVTPRACVHRVERAANASQASAPARCAASRGRPGLDLLDDAAADHDRVGMRGDRLRARGIANAEADADRQLRHGGGSRRACARRRAVSRWPAPVTPLSDT